MRHHFLSAGSRQHQLTEAPELRDAWPSARAPEELGSERPTILTAESRPAVVIKRMTASDCHGNAATLFRAGKGMIATGYALDEDGLWRQHSWVVDSKRRVIETTVRRKAYYGIVCDETGSGLLADLFLRVTTEKKGGH